MQATTKTNRKARVALEEDKLRQTTHWDMDYLPMETVESLHVRQASGTAETATPRMPPKRLSSRQLGAICILAGMGLLLFALAIARFFAH